MHTEDPTGFMRSKTDAHMSPQAQLRGPVPRLVDQLPTTTTTSTHTWLQVTLAGVAGGRYPHTPTPHPTGYGKHKTVAQIKHPQPTANRKTVSFGLGECKSEAHCDSLQCQG